jgi:hypothetical protein
MTMGRFGVVARMVIPSAPPLLAGIIALARFLARTPTFRAAHRVIQKALLRIKLLLSGSKDKILSAIPTHEYTICVAHTNSL